jgi:predicted amino acid-binding ACT domain protein
MRTADISLLTLWARSNNNQTSTLSCIPERDSQFQDFAQSAELNAIEELVVHVTAEDRGGDFVRVLENIAKLNANIDAIEAVTLDGKTGWVIKTDKAHINSVLKQVNDDE